MSTLDDSAKASALTLYVSVKSNYRIFRRQWQRQNPNKTLPSKRFMTRLLSRFQETGSITKRKPPGRKRSQRTMENISYVAEYFAINTDHSPATFVRDTGIASVSSVWRMLRHDIGWRPFKPKRIHKISDVNINIRYWFCHDFIRMLSSDCDIPSRMIFFDEVRENQLFLSS